MPDIRVLYLSYDGLTDPLGQSQVLPYLSGLAARGIDIRVISFEKEGNWEQLRTRIQGIVDEAGITWYPMKYHKRPPILSTLLDIYLLKRKVRQLYKEKAFDIIHCRSYITSFAGLDIQKKKGVKFLFDMRGFFADERVEGGIWDLNKPVFKSVYNYFKKKEIEYFTKADHSVCLTQKGKEIIQSWKQIPRQPIPVEVIPCCVDMDHFNRERIDTEKSKHFRKEIGITDDDFILSYLGSIGSWYMLEEMLDFFIVLLSRKPNAKFLLISGEPPTSIYRLSDERGIARKHILIRKVPYSEVPDLVSLSDMSLFFIKPVFSKSASSPTKQGELMSLGIPLICNRGVGDTDLIVEDSNCGILVDDFDEANYHKAIDQIDEAINLDPEDIRKGAEKYYSLEKGISRYEHIYKKLTDSK